MQAIVGNLVRDSHQLMDGEVFADVTPGGETVIGLIRGNFIEVKESGYYNGIYEQMGENEGRPAFKMVTPDHPRAGTRYVYYSSEGQRIVPGWKFNNRYCPEVGEWDMLSPGGVPGTGNKADDDIPEGKFEIYNGGTNVKPNAPRISKLVTQRSGLMAQSLRSTAAMQEQENIEGTEAGGCFNGEAMILMADGTHKQARAVQVGDALRSATGNGQTTVEACIREAKDRQQLVKLRELIITPHHPVVHAGRWTFPHEVPGSCFVDADIELYNFITSNRDAIHVEDFVATSIGTYCEGLHNIEQNSEHRVWGTDLIVDIYKQHPDWPNITSNTKDTIAAVSAAQAGSSGQLWCSGSTQVTRKGASSDHLVEAKQGIM